MKLFGGFQFGGIMFKKSLGLGSIINCNTKFVQISHVYILEWLLVIFLVYQLSYHPVVTFLGLLLNYIRVI